VAALIVAAYAAASRHDVDGTTEVAALVVLAAGTLAVTGSTQLSSALIAVTLLLLIEKHRLHALVRLIDDLGFRAGVRFAVMALVVLPLLPEGPYGPLGGIRPRTLWAVVLFFSGLSFAGYVARTLVGERYGIAVTGLLGGLVSSTNVTLTYARLSRARPEEGAHLAEGVLAACTILFVRVVAAVAVLNAALLPDLIPLVAAPLALGSVIVLMRMRHRTEAPAPPVPAGNPLQLGAALQMAAAFQAVLFLLDFVVRRFGSPGLTASAVLLGLTDVDALTASIAGRVSAGLAPGVGATAIAAGIVANSFTKLGLALALGRGRFRTLAGAGLAAIAGAGLAALLVRFAW
jgi:uncharacterized membrane protein (DUF4010 family)